MGIKNLNKFILKKAPNSYQKKNFSEYSGKKIAIDIENMLYKFRSAAGKQSFHKQEFFHIYSLLLNVIKFLDNGILPIYVFDGKPPDAKKENCLDKRYKEKEKNYQELVLIEEQFQKIIQEKNNYAEKNNPFIDEDFDEFHNCSVKYVSDQDTDEILRNLEMAQNKLTIVTKKHRQECKELLDKLGIPYLCLEAEAECVCIYLCAKGLADYVYSEDTDCITYGSSVVSEFNDLLILKKGMNDSFYEFSTKKFLETINFTRDQFIDFCILMGCDYCPSSKINSSSLYRLIKDSHSIDNTGINFGPLFKYREARDIFKGFYSDIEKLTSEMTLEFKLDKYYYNDLSLMLDKKNLGKYMIVHKKFLENNKKMI